MQRIQQNWRHIFRHEFRALRDSIVATSNKQHNYVDGIINSVSTDECTELEKADLSSLMVLTI